jgi:transposase-like protein
MGICVLCEEQSKKTRNGKPHACLSKIDDPRLFKGGGSRGFEEQDYQCQTCRARFTNSTDKNDLSWTLWRG